MSLNVSIEQLKFESTAGRTISERAEMILVLNKQLGDALTENSALKARVAELEKSISPQSQDNNKKET